MFFIEDLDNGNDMNGVDGAGSGVCKDGDENVLFDIERTRIQRELPPASFCRKILQNKINLDIKKIYIYNVKYGYIPTRHL